MLTYGIPHYRLPKTIVDSYVQALEKMGRSLCFEHDGWTGYRAGRNSSSRNDAVYMGYRRMAQPVLGLEGENLTEFGLNFLTEVNTYLKRR